MRPSHSFTSLVLLSLSTSALCAAVWPRAQPVALSSNQVNAFTPFTFFAAAAYCEPTSTANWSCPACEGNSDFEPTASGGDGDAVQFWYVGYSPSLDTVVVAHQGTNFSKIDPALTDADIFREQLDANLFPGVPSSVEVHGGFKHAQSLTATSILQAVKATMKRTGTKKVTVSSHSLGAAIGILDAVMLKMQLPKTISFKMVFYGLPRVGNDDFANFVDKELGGRLSRITNQQDPVPILPGLFLGFHHPSGEVHINSTGSFLACAGQESEQTGCTIEAVETIFSSNTNNHDGPYNGLRMKCAQAPGVVLSST